jgi:hypothetical protein
MKIWKLALDNANTDRIDVDKAMDILRGYGKILYEEIEKAASGLTAEKKAIDAALSAGGLRDADVGNLISKYEDIAKSLQYLGSIADLLIANDPVRWAEAKTTGIGKKTLKSFSTPGASLGGQQVNAPSSSAVPTPPAGQPTASTTPTQPQSTPPAASPAQSPGQSSTPAISQPQGADSSEAAVEESVEEKEDPAVTARVSERFNETISEIAKKANDEWISPLTYKDLVKSVNSLQEAIVPGEGRAFYPSNSIQDIYNVLKFYCVYKESIDDIAKYDEVPETILFDEKRIDDFYREDGRYLVNQTIEEIKSQGNSKKYFSDSIFKPVMKYVRQVSGREKTENRVVASIYRIRKVLAAESADTSEMASTPTTSTATTPIDTIKKYNDNFMVHVQQIAKHIASVFRGVSKYIDRPEVSSNQALYEMLNTVLKTLRWSASIVANMIDDNASSSSFWTEVKTNGLKMMGRDDIAKKLVAGDIDPNDILSAAITKAEEKIKLDDSDSESSQTPATSATTTPPTASTPVPVAPQVAAPPDANPSTQVSDTSNLPFGTFIGTDEYNKIKAIIDRLKNQGKKGGFVNLPVEKNDNETDSDFSSRINGYKDLLSRYNETVIDGWKINIEKDNLSFLKSKEGESFDYLQGAIVYDPTKITDVRHLRNPQNRPARTNIIRPPTNSPNIAVAPAENSSSPEANAPDGVAS